MPHCPGLRSRCLLNVAIALSLLTCACPGQTSAAETEEGQPLEYQVKATFLLNFTKFIEWPAMESAPADAPFTICILGDDPFGSAIDQIVEGETVNGRKLEIQRIRGEPPKTCRMLYVSKSEKGVSELLGSVGRGVLTIGEGDRFFRQGGMIAFVIADRRVRFDINQRAAGSAGLKISSRLLSVARAVER